MKTYKENVSWTKILSKKILPKVFFILENIKINKNQNVCIKMNKDLGGTIYTLQKYKYAEKTTNNETTRKRT